MKSVTRQFLLLFAVCANSFLFSLNLGDSETLDQRDIEALRDWIQTKRQVTIKELGGNLSVSGEVRAELQSSTEKRNGIRQRGTGGAIPLVPTRAYDIEVNIMLDYRADLTWATIKLEFDNNAGTVSGTFNRLALERAFFGARVMNGDTYTSDIEVGRRRLNYTFDSRIEFNSFMDGIMLKYDRAFDTLGDFYLHGGPFVVDEFRNQYAYVFEVAVLNMFNTGIYTKYSFVNWNTTQLPTVERRRAFRFMDSQVIIGYKTVPKWLGKMVTFYMAGLKNHAAHRLELTGWKKKNYAGYIGFSAGELRQKNDWSLDFNYQWVQAQSIPMFDVSGVGTGNAGFAGFYTTIGPFGMLGVPTTRQNAAGNTNYRGISLEFLYLLTNNLTLFQAWVQSSTLDKSIGPGVRFKLYEVELIYTF